jgi:hypothetical protein
MSASICYRPIPKTDKTLAAMAPSVLIQSLEEVFGPLPLRLDGGCRRLLGAMRASCSDTAMKKCYEELGVAIEKHGEIEVWAKY